MRRTLTVVATFGLSIAATGLVAFAPAAAGGGGSCSADVSIAGAITQVVDDHVCWSPVVGRVAVGQTLTFVNRSGLEHNLTGPGPIGYHDFGAGATVRLTFPAAGIFPYACTFHPGMAGAVVVGDPLSDALTPAVLTPAVQTPAVQLSSGDDGGSSLLGSTPRAVGAGAAVAGALGLAGAVVVRRRRTLTLG